MLWDRWPVSQYCTVKSRQWRLEKENNAAGKDEAELPVPLHQENWSLNMRAKLRVTQESKQLITAKGDLYFRISSNKGKGLIQALMT